MKTKFLLSVLLGAASFSFAQQGSVGIGTTKPDNSAILDLSASNKGILIPRMSLTERNLINSPAVGLKIYQTDGISGEYFFDGNKWNRILTDNEAKSIAVANPDNWSITGNTALVAGTNFIGANIPLEFKQNGVRVGLLSDGTNMFLGRSAGKINTANFNVGIGYNALENNSTGPNNVAIGYLAMTANSTGEGNSAIGPYALWSNTTGYWNVAIGQNALVYNTTGAGNTAISNDALYSNTTGNFNTGIGRNSLHDNTTGSSNMAIGQNALFKNTTGSNSLAIGNGAGFNNITGSSNVFLGQNAGYNETGSDKLYIANSNTANPLLKGDFATNALKINSKSTGYLAVGDFDAASPMPIPTGYRLIVQDGILTEKIKVALRTSSTDWADYVFAKEYKLMPLDEVEQFTKINKHLPNVPSADEMVKEGLDVAKTSKMFMEKIEELTLYMIELKKEINALKAENVKLMK